MTEIESANRRLELESGALREKVAEEHKCLAEICGYLSSRHNAPLSTADLSLVSHGTDKARRICDGIAAAFEEKEKAAFHRGHDGLVGELEALKGEYQHLRMECQGR